MGFASAVRADQRHTLTVIDLVAERMKQVVHRDAVELGHAACRIRTPQADINLLVGHGRWRWASGHELFPTRFGAVGFGGILEILRSPLFHDFHVVKQSSLFFVPSF